MAHWFSWDVLIFLGIFGANIIYFGFWEALWELVLLNSGYLLAALLLWWQDEYRWRKNNAPEGEYPITQQSIASPNAQHSPPSQIS